MGAPFQGNGGSVKIGGTAIGKVNSGTYTGLDREVLIKTVLGDEVESKELSDVLQPGVASVEMFYDYAGEEQTVIDDIVSGGNVVLEVDLTVSGSSIVSGSALARNLAVTNPGGATDYVAVTCDFEFTDVAPIFTQPSE